MTDLLIGAVDLYDWTQIRVWANSIRESGFDGDIALIAYRVSEDVVINADKLLIDVYKFEHDPFGRAISHNDRGRNTQSHQLRFFHAWQLLSNDNMWGNYRNIIMTDVRDVYFQTNPFEQMSAFMDMPSFPTKAKLIASSEAIAYKDEPWGADNMLQGFGPIVAAEAQEWVIYNVGVIGGKAEAFKALCFDIYHMTVGRYIPSDQSAYNTIVRNHHSDFMLAVHHHPWACQCGTTLDPTKEHFRPHLLSPLPHIYRGLVYPTNTSSQPYAIVHQYDRVPELNYHIINKYV